MSYLDELNPAQRSAVLQKDGPLLVIAGAGAGKTKTVTHRIYHLIQGGVAPEAILAITFTNKAAGEMRERVNRLLGENEESGRPFIGTFHRLGVQLLRENSRRLDLTQFFTILDRDDSLALIKSAQEELGINPKEYEPRRILGVISKEKNRLRTVSDYEARATESRLGGIVLPVWRRYEAKKTSSRALDFDDLLVKTVRLLESDAELLAHYQDRWRYVHIDEYQDTNSVQYNLAKLLAAKHRNVCVVGDVDQSIYSWRGADFKNLLRFEKDYPEAKIVMLEQNYRSTKNILQAANEIIAKNVFRQPKNLFTDNAEGEKLTLMIALSETEEASLVAQKARDAIRAGVPPEEIAILYRANFQSRVLEEACLQHGVPYHVLGTRFFERREVKDMVALIKLALNPDDIESLKRVINVPPRGIGKVTVAKVVTGAERELPLATRAKIETFRELLAEIKTAVSTKPASQALRFALDRSGIAAWLREGTEDDQERLANLQELVTLALKYDADPPGEGIWRLVADATLASDADSLEDAPQGVRLMTVHAAKGLEFRVVCITGLEQDLFPHKGGRGDTDRDEEEERRLFYVALTRAKEKLYLSYAQVRTIFGRQQVTLPSEFLLDLPPHLVETATPAWSESAIDF